VAWCALACGIDSHFCYRIDIDAIKKQGEFLQVLFYDQFNQDYKIDAGWPPGARSDCEREEHAMAETGMRCAACKSA
jgi:hypothetical protein